MSKLLVERSSRRIHNIDRHAGVVSGGAGRAGWVCRRQTWVHEPSDMKYYLEPSIDCT